MAEGGTLLHPGLYAQDVISFAEEFYRRTGLVSSGPRALPAEVATAQSEWKSLEQRRGVLQ